jgi:hypothetical protein
LFSTSSLRLALQQVAADPAADGDTQGHDDDEDEVELDQQLHHLAP